MAESIKVACIGDSITYGLKLPDIDEDKYPNQLQNLLGDLYVVHPGLGCCNASVRNNSPLPYASTKEYQTATKWPADIIVICLGTNDSLYPYNEEFMHHFKRDYLALVEDLKITAPNASVYICMVPPVLGLENISANIPEINSLIRIVALSCNASLIDLYTPMTSRDELFSDGIHPNEAGARLIAEIVYDAITKSHDERQGPPVRI